MRVNRLHKKTPDFWGLFDCVKRVLQINAILFFLRGFMFFDNFFS